MTYAKMVNVQTFAVDVGFRHTTTARQTIRTVIEPAATADEPAIGIRLLGQIEPTYIKV